MPGAFQNHYHHIDTLSLYQEGMVLKTVQSQMANSPVRTYNYFTMVNPDDDLVHDNFHNSVYMENNSFETSILLMQDLLPVSILIPQFIQFTENTVALRALFDSGGTVTLVHAQVLTNNVISTQSNTQTFTTITKQFESKQRVQLKKNYTPRVQTNSKN